MVIKKLFLLLVMLHSVSGYGDMIKCTDANGHIDYSNKPCDNNVASKTIHAPSTQKTSNLNEIDSSKQDVKTISTTSTQELPASRDQPSNSKLPTNSWQTYRCDGRTYCSQMSSCEEATFFINHCPETKMDGDMDGIPCESQWCGN
jgi:hypothetical protein